MTLDNDNDYGPGMAFAQANAQMEAAFKHGAPLENPNANSAGSEIDLSSPEGRKALGDAMWEEAQQRYDFGGLSQEQISAAAEQTTRLRGYKAEDLLDADVRTEHLAVTAATLGVRRKASGDAHRTGGLSYGGRRAKGDTTEDEPHPNDRGLSADERANMAWLREMKEMQQKGQA